MRKIKLYSIDIYFLLMQNMLLSIYFISLDYPVLHNVLVDEDNVGEWVQFAAYLSAAIISSFKFFRSVRIEKLEYGVLAMALFLLAGEEISWGQRIFNFSLPVIQNLNEQSEVNLHNLFPLYGNVDVYIWWAILFSIVAPAFAAIIKYMMVKAYGRSFNSVFFNVGFCLIHFELMLFYLVLPQEHYVFLYEHTELNIALAFLYLIGKKKVSCD